MNTFYADTKSPVTPRRATTPTKTHLSRASTQPLSWYQDPIYYDQHHSVKSPAAVHLSSPMYCQQRSSRAPHLTCVGETTNYSSPTTALTGRQPQWTSTSSATTTTNNNIMGSVLSPTAKVSSIGLHTSIAPKQLRHSTTSQSISWNGCSSPSSNSNSSTSNNNNNNNHFTAAIIDAALFLPSSPSSSTSRKKWLDDADIFNNSSSHSSWPNHHHHHQQHSTLPYSSSSTAGSVSLLNHHSTRATTPHCTTRRATTPTKTISPSQTNLLHHIPSSLIGGATTRAYSPTATVRQSSAQQQVRLGEFTPNSINTPRQKFPYHIDNDDLSSSLSTAPPVTPTSTTPPTSRMQLKRFVSKWNCKHQENQNNYREGGYCSLKAGSTLQQRYLLLQKLGWGEFSTVWLAADAANHNPMGRNSIVAVKVAKCSSQVVESTKYEVNLLKYMKSTMSSGCPVTQLLDCFEHRGDFGNHLCMVMPVCGSNLLCVIDQMKIKGKQRRSESEVTMIKDITKSVLQGLVGLHNANVVHTDLKPENILCAAPDPKIAQLVAPYFKQQQLQDGSNNHNFEDGDPFHLVHIADFGLSVLMQLPSSTSSSDAVGGKKEFRIVHNGAISNTNGTLIQTREYRSPEVLFGSEFCSRTDVWSVGCIIFELITGEFLMDPKRRTNVERDMDIEHLILMMQIIGPVPNRITSLLRTSTSPPRYLHRFFNESGIFLFPGKVRNSPRRCLAAELEVYLNPVEAERAAQFIMSCFTYDPTERCHASDLLRHSWFN